MKKEIDSEFDFHYDLAKFEVEMLNSRSNLFLLFHSLLITGTAQVWGLVDPNSILLKTVFSILGILVTMIWVWLAIRTSEVEKACYKQLNEYEIFISVAGEDKKIGNRHIISIILPSIILVCWFSILLLVYFK